MSAWPSVAKIGKPLQDLGPWVWNTSREVRNAMVTSNHLKPYSPSSTQSTVIRAHDWCKITSWRIPGGSCTYAAKSWFWRCSSFNRTSGNFCVTPSCSCGPAKPRNVCNNISLSWPGPLPWVVCYMLQPATPLLPSHTLWESDFFRVHPNKNKIYHKPQGSPTNRLSRNLKTMISKESPFPEIHVQLAC